MENLITSIAGPLILLLLGIIGYFIVRDAKRQDKTNTMLFDHLDRQRESTDKLNITLTALNGVILASQDKFDEFEKRYEEHKDVCKYKFEEIKK